MANVKLNFRRLPITEKIARARQIVQQMTDNAANFPNPVPPLVDVTAAIDAADQARKDAEEARTLAKQRTAVLEEAEDALIKAMSRLASYVDSASAGKEDVILSSGMDTRAPRSAANLIPGTPPTITLTMGDHEGEIDASWDAVEGARSYILQMSPNEPKDDTWTQVAVVTVSKYTVKNLTSGTKYWFRVAAVGSGGQSAWSDPAVRMAP
jgi:hypothetical protein